MNFTREPIIETVITPRDGCKLVIRSSKGNGQEDYFVDAVEVVSFGHSFFFRSLERPKSFLVPMSDYEVLELKETRMVLKNASPERAIKIGGGREAAPPRHREPVEERREEKREEPAAPGEPTGVLPLNPGDRKRDKRRRGRRSGRDRHEPMHEARPKVEEIATEGGEMNEMELAREEPQAPSFISKLFPPPPTLIKETLSRYKTAEIVEQDLFVAPPIEEKAPHHYDESIFDHPISDEEMKDDSHEEREPLHEETKDDEE